VDPKRLSQRLDSDRCQWGHLCVRRLTGQATSAARFARECVFRWDGGAAQGYRVILIKTPAEI